MMISSTCGKSIGFGTLYDFTPTVPFGIYRYPALQKCSHDIFSSQAAVKLYKAQAYQYSPNVIIKKKSLQYILARIQS